MQSLGCQLCLRIYQLTVQASNFYQKSISILLLRQLLQVFRGLPQPALCGNPSAGAPSQLDRCLIVKQCRNFKSTTVSVLQGCGYNPALVQKITVPFRSNRYLRIISLLGWCKLIWGWGCPIWPVSQDSRDPTRNFQSASILMMRC